jgi:hypothetical protein
VRVRVGAIAAIGATTAAIGAATAAIGAATAAIVDAAASAPEVTSMPPAAPASSAPDDPLATAQCRRALAALDAEEAAVAEAARGSGGVTANDRRLIDARLAPARRQAATACLARRADQAKPSSQRLVRPAPIAAPPLAVAPTSSPAPAPATARAAPLASPPVRVDKPYAITSCDSGGCWANDGSRLDRVGPNLWGPRGVCTVQGSLLQCP